MLASAAAQVSARFEAVDSNGLLPLRAPDRAFATAYAFRRHLQAHLRPHLAHLPDPDPLASIAVPWSGDLPHDVVARWPPVPEHALADAPAFAAELPIDHTVAPAPVRGGALAGESAAAGFVGHRLADYADGRNQPEQEATSGLSPYLHFGHVSAHEVFSMVMTRERWTTRALGSRATGQREGWWGVSASAEGFIDQLVTWRELGFNACQFMPGHDQYGSLPAWAQQSLAAHASDSRPHLYALDDFERARTHDRLWNAAQGQLAREGRIHNYLRMLWGKKILEWSPTPQDALAVMIELNNKYALDGRDPNSYSGIFWVLGRYDRPWAPQRPVFGSIRYMSSENTARKLRVRNYVARYAP
jgi:deoxyribodipyrimidine photo-lyase